jgi:hypothetical protein
VIEVLVPRIGGASSWPAHSGVVLVHVDLFENDMAFAVDLVSAEGGTLQHLGQDLDPHREIGVAHASPEPGVFLRGEGVVPGTDGIEGLADVPSRPNL